MRGVIPKGAFKRNLKRVEKRGWHLMKLHSIIALLQEGRPLPEHCRPHKLSGAYAGLWECHIEHDWVLVYAVTPSDVILYRTGSHADLFE